MHRQRYIAPVSGAAHPATQQLNFQASRSMNRSLGGGAPRGFAPAATGNLWDVEPIPLGGPSAVYYCLSITPIIFSFPGVYKDGNATFASPSRTRDVAFQQEAAPQPQSFVSSPNVRTVH